jgi:4-aminobutyrate aminotransferase-like enzyme
MTEGNNKRHLIPVIPFESRVMSYGKGSYLYDAGGEKYLDLNAGQFCAVLGHSNAEILDQAWKSAGRLAHTSTNIVSSEVVACANSIHRISGDMKASSILLSTGAEAVEFCLRYAKCIRKKTGIICFDRGYHGLTLGAQSVTFSGIYARPVLQDIYAIPVPREDNVDISIANLEYIMRTHEVAAIIVEPIVSVGGMLFPPAGWFRKVRSLCDHYQIVMLLDECQTGFGRTGNWFAYQTYGFVPDMVAAAKGIGLGFPVAVAMFRETLIPEEGGYPITHFSSHQNDPFPASIVNIGIEYIEKFNLFHRIKDKSSFFLQRLKELEQKNTHIVDARGCGLMLGADLSFDATDDYRTLFNRLYQQMMEHGVIIQGTNGGRTLRFLPDYLIGRKDIDYALEVLHHVLLTKILP